jgi:hypothetical protein
MDGIDAARLHEQQHLLTSSRAEMAELENKIQLERAQVASTLQACGRATSQEDKGDCEKLQSLLSNYWQAQDQVISLSRNKSDPKAAEAAYKLGLGDSLQAFDARNTALAWAKHNQLFAGALTQNGSRSIGPRRAL